MKRALISVIIMAMILAFTACGGGANPTDSPAPSSESPESTTALTAEQVVNYFALKGMPIGNVVEMSSRPGSYTSKVNFEDSRTLKEGESPVIGTPQNTVEVFATVNAAQARYDDLRYTSLEQYIFLVDTIMLRLRKPLTPEEAEGYELLLNEAINDSEAAISAPRATAIIQSGEAETPAPVESHAPEESSNPKTYPLASTSKYLDTATDMPEIIFSTTGAENGLIGVVYFFSGTAKESGILETDGGDLPYIFVETEYGDVVVCDYYAAAKNSQPEVFDFLIREENADYSFPAEGEYADFICTYNGYSGVFEMPTFILGANHFFIETTDTSSTPAPTESPIPAEEQPIPTTAPTPDATSDPTPTPAPATQMTVYRTPTGKRYHYSASCAGKNAKAIDISQIGSLTPCGTCVY